jgi:hypothetical protein
MFFVPTKRIGTQKIINQRISISTKPVIYKLLISQHLLVLFLVTMMFLQELPASSNRFQMPRRLLPGNPLCNVKLGQSIKAYNGSFCSSFSKSALASAFLPVIVVGNIATFCTNSLHLLMP